jgi:hypothetical protein
MPCDLAGVGVGESQRGVYPDAVGEAHRGPAAAISSEHAQRDVRGERGGGTAAGGAEEGDDLVKRGTPRARAEEHERRVEGEWGDGEVGAEPGRLAMWRSAGTEKAASACSMDGGAAWGLARLAAS